MTFAIFGYKYARPRGLGRRIKDNMHWQQFTVSTISALLIGVITAGWIGLVCFGVAGLLTFIVAHFTMRRIHGLTGDVYGAINELTELATLLFNEELEYQSAFVTHPLWFNRLEYAK